MDPTEIFRAAGYDSRNPSTILSRKPQTLPADDANEQYYDDDYFDSDMEDDDDKEKQENKGTRAADGSNLKGIPRLNESAKKKQGAKGILRKKVPTNDELFYDPAADSDDEKWLENKIQSRRAKTPGKTQAFGRLGASDATLSCPMCLTDVCYDCQQHIHYDSQFRAMFFENCVVDKGEVVRYPKEKSKGKGKLVTTEELDKDVTEDEVYWSVECETCGTQVGVMDEDEVVHFFNVIAT
ncbi:hypothetical protein SpCBS45565_g07869 [Spizellomyces sp. 'palustris']|nr:hypothetical protein SpCBS45565_g07869 [Spizellomyces sp. 'palustris']